MTNAATDAPAAPPEPLLPPSSPLARVRGDWFPYAIAVALIAFCVIVRGVLHVPLGPDNGGAGPNATRASTATLADPADNLTYAAWAQQCRRGEFLMNSLYTIEPHPALLFNPYFALVGVLARITGVHVLLAMNLLGLVAAGVAIIVVYHTAMALDLPRMAARWAVLLLAFGSGLTACQHVLTAWLLGRRLVNGVDVVYLDAIGHSTFVVFPYHSVALALAALVTWTIVLALRPASADRARHMVAAFVLTLLLSWVHPYEILLPLAAMVCWTVLGEIFVDPNDTTRRARITLCILLCVAAAPQVLYGLYVSAQPVWGDMLRIAREVPIRARQWIVGYGMLLVLSIVGCRRVLARGFWLDASGWLACWLAAVVALLIVLQISFTKLTDGVSIMMCLLGGCGVGILWQGASSRLSLRIGVVALLILPFTTPILLLSVYSAYASGLGNPPATYDPEIATLLGDPNHVPAERLDVLCDAQGGAYLSGLYGYRVFAGNWALTPDFQTGAATLASAGITPYAPLAAEQAAADRPPSSLETFKHLLTSHKWDRVLLARRSDAEVFIIGEAGWRQLGSTSRYVLFTRE